MLELCITSAIKLLSSHVGMDGGRGGVLGHTVNNKYYDGLLWYYKMNMCVDVHANLWIYAVVPTSHNPCLLLSMARSCYMQNRNVPALREFNS
jgi:hypothetical protein